MGENGEDELGKFEYLTCPEISMPLVFNIFQWWHTMFISPFFYFMDKHNDLNSLI